MICGKAPFPSLTLQIQWAAMVWKDSQDKRNQEKGNVDAPHYELSDRVIRVIKNRGSRIRNELLDHVRTAVQSHFNFRVDRASHKAKNEKIAEKLLKDKSFLYKAYKLDGYAQNPVILSVLIAAWFKTEASMGVVFREYFEPISINTLAFILTVIDFCICEWKTGKQKKGVFSEKIFSEKFEAFATDLKRWSNINPVVTRNRRMKLFRRAL
ncbi:hypothetical protein H0H92_014210 [Tricholoma furcatifolium]|nr:hypothetical protein H0H92_014210 [Tricholoma furcatifolium]